MIIIEKSGIGSQIYNFVNNTGSRLISNESSKIECFKTSETDFNIKFYTYF